MDQLENVFIVDLGTCNVKKFAEAYEAVSYDVNLLRDRCDRDISADEINTEKENVTLFDGSIRKPVMNMPKYITEKNEGDEKTYIDKDGDEIISSYKHSLVVHFASGFDSWVLQNSWVKEITELKNVETARELFSLSFRCGVEIVITVEVPY